MSAYSGIRKACFLITLDNGGLNRWRPEKAVHKSITDFLASRAYESSVLATIDSWLSSLSDEGLERACVGEQSEMEAFLTEHSPPFTNALLDEYFEDWGP